MDKINLTKNHNVIDAYRSQNYDIVRKSYDDAGTKYAFDVLDQKITAGYKIQLACFRHIQDLRRITETDNFPYIYDVKKVAGILNFAKLCPDVNAMKPLPLLPWEKFILASLNGWRMSDGSKRFTQANVSVAREQGKTYFASIDICYSFLIEGIGLANQDFLAAANTTDQIDKLFGYVSYMTNYLIDNEEFFKEIKKAEGIDVQAKRIVTKKSINNRLVRISNESGKFDGYHFKKAVYDEAGDENAGKYTSRIITGQNDVPNHQFVKISTAYEFLNTEFHRDLKRMTEYMERDYERIGDRQLCLIWCQDSENEVFKPETWEKSNPLLALKNQRKKRTQNLIDLRDNLTSQGKITEFQNKNMNLYLQTETSSFINLSDVERAVIPEFNVDGRQVYIGFDYSMFSDNTALAFIYPYNEKGKNRWFIYQHSFIPWQHAGSISAKEKQDNINYRALVNKGFCTITNHPQGLINNDQVYMWLRKYIDKHNLDVVFFGYDAWNATPMIKALEVNTSWPLMPIRQRTSELKDSTKFLQAGFIEGSIKTLDDAIMQKALLNAQLKQDSIGIQVDKDKATLKIDVVDALVDAGTQAQYHFEDFADVNDPAKQVDRLTEEQVLAIYKNPKYDLLGGDDPDF